MQAEHVVDGLHFKITRVGEANVGLNAGRPVDYGIPCVRVELDANMTRGNGDKYGASR